MGGADEALVTLTEGEIEVLGLLPYSSNYTFLARVTTADAQVHAVYKPRSGERPLWDFPHGTLAAREVAAWMVSEASWKIVPTTVLRPDAPLGEGSLQLFIEHDPERHYFALMESRLDELAAFAAFDAVINNADRKAGHVIEDAGGRMCAVDHGLTFHTDHKLRTVIWTFAEAKLTPEVRGVLGGLASALDDAGGLGGELAALLTPAEAAATLERVEELLAEDRFPSPQGDRHLPWPLI
ncbi:MAG: SCO1664 family protein [Actinomycetota bacterium]